MRRTWAMIRMQKTLPDNETLRFFTCIVLLLAFATALAGSPEDYRSARAEMITAYQAEDFPAMRAAAARALDARPGYAGALFNLSFAEVLDGDAEASLATLGLLLKKQIDFGVADIDEFAALQELPEWHDYAAAVAELYEPRGHAEVAYEHADGDFVPEGIAVTDDGTLYLGSIRHGHIVRVGEATSEILTAADGSHWSVFGMRLADDGLLWFVSSAISEFAELDAADEGRTGLFAVDTNTGEIMVQANLPETSDRQILGDLIFVDEDTLLLADQTDGVIYSYSISANEFSTFLEKGVLASPQGLVLDESGETLYVADYIGGLFRIDVSSGTAERVTPLPSASDYGIDGLYRYGNKLIGIQNGFQPNRVVAFTLADDGASVTAAEILAMNLPEFDEPNLGVVRGDEFLFIANSHWNRFDPDGNLPDGLSGPTVMRIKLVE